MQNNLIILICVGEPVWADFTLNLVLSIKANSPKQKIGLLYESATIAALKPLFDKYCDYGYEVDNVGLRGHELAFYLKTRLYDYAVPMAPDMDGYLFIDSDCLLLPNPNDSVQRWFEKLDGIKFTMYCNDVYNIQTKTRIRKDYTWWCEPEEAVEMYGLDDKLPQVNSSFIYFQRCDTARVLFATAKEIYGHPKIDFKKYKNAAPDEFAFNIACALTKTYPHQTHFRPIWFQFASEIQNCEYIAHFYRAFGFAGVMKPFEYLINHYNSLSNYYREHFAIVPRFKMDTTELMLRDPNPIVLQPVAKKTLYRRGELTNSDGGVFNPDQLLMPDGSLMTIVRKERNMDAYGNYSGGTGIAELAICDNRLKDHLKNRQYELAPVDYNETYRLEDFRMFNIGFQVWCNHKMVINGKQGEREMKTALARINENKLIYFSTPELPIELQKCDINWMFFCDDVAPKKYPSERVYCVYQLNPYTLFKINLNGAWERVEVAQPKLDWFHKDQFICNSTNPILIDDHYLMFFHTREAGVYHHGAVLLDKTTKEIAYYTRNSILIKEQSLIEGWNKTILYVSGAVYFEDRKVVRVLFGEGDSSACYHEYDSGGLIGAIKDSYMQGVEPEEVPHSNEDAIEKLKKLTE